MFIVSFRNLRSRLPENYDISRPYASETNEYIPRVFGWPPNTDGREHIENLTGINSVVNVDENLR